MRIGWIFLFGIAFVACQSKTTAPSQEKPSFPVRVALAEEKEANLFLEMLGHIESMVSIQIRSRIEGELTGVYFEQGQEVKKGDLLFTIDPKPYEAILKAAQGALQESEANFALAAEKVKRYRTLAQDEYYSQIDFETLQANFAALQAEVEQNKARVDQASIDLDYCWIYAPIEGKTGILQIDYGNLVSADGPTPLLILNQMTPLFVTFSLPEFQLPAVQTYQQKGTLKVLAAFEDFHSTPFEGSLYMIDNQVDQKTGMIKLRALFDNEQRLLWPGQFIRVRLVLAALPHATVIPYAAIQLTQTGPVVFVVKEGNVVEQRAVRLGQREDDQVVILEGIQPGEKVVVEGQINLATGSHVIPKAG